MTTLILPLIGVLLGGGISLISVYLQQTYQNKRETKKLKLEKLEAAHKAISKIRKSYAVFTFALSLLLVNEKLAQKQISENNELDVSLYDLEMFVGFYAPILLDKVEQLRKLSTDYSNETARVVKDKSDLLKASSNSDLLMKRFEGIDKICKEMQKDLAAISKNFTE